MTNTQLTNPLKTQIFTLGGFTVNPQEHTLRLTPTNGNNPKTHQLPTKCIEVLCYLVERYPEVISRQELIDAIWEGNISVGQKSLTNAIWSLRKVLNQNPEQIQAITTIRKSGYKLELEPQIEPQIETQLEPLLTPQAPQTAQQFTKAPADTNETADNSTPLFTQESNSKTEDKQQSAANKTQNLHAITVEKAPLWLRQIAQRITSRHLSVFFFLCIAIYAMLKTVFTFTPEHRKEPKILTPITTITSHPGRELYPSTSVNGQWLAYIWFRVDLTSELHLINLKAPQPQTVSLSVSPHRYLKPIWHPDNQTLFMIEKNNEQKRCQVIKIDRQSQIAEPVVNCSYQAHGFLTIDKSGEYLYYTGEQSVNTYNNQSVQVPGRYRINLIKNTPPERLSCLHECNYQDRDIEFSPNGLFSAEVRKYTPDTEDLYIVNQQTQKVTRLTHDYQQLRGIQWASNSRHLIVSAQTHGQRQGFILDSQTGVRKNINIEGFSYPNINYHNQNIYYHEWQQKKFISTVKLGQSQQGTYPLLQANHDFYHPHYNPKLDKITFISTESGFSEIWIADADGNNRMQLTNNKQIIKYPRFSFDGQYIAFLAPQIGNDQNLLKVLNLNDNQIITVRSPFRIHRRPTWHTSNQHLLSAIEDDHIHSLQLFDIHSKDKPKEILADTLYAQMRSNGDIIYTAHKNGIWIKSGNKQLQLLEHEQLGSFFNWSYHQEHLYFEKASDKSQIISKLNMQTGNIDNISNLAKRTLDIYGTTTFINTSKELLLSKQQFPQVDIKKVQLTYE